MNRPLDVGHTIESLSRNLNMIVDSCINTNFNIVSSKGSHSVEIDDVSLHVEDMNFISARVKVLKP